MKNSFAIKQTPSNPYQATNEFASAKKFVSQTQQSLETLIERGGPQEEEYTTFEELIQELYKLYISQPTKQYMVEPLKRLFDSDFLSNTIHGHILTKPYGYAGDFHIIDKIYTRHTSSHPNYKKWDSYFHSLSTTKAVVNRKTFFKELLTSKVKGQHQPLDLLNVASGPARDLMELYERIEPQGLNTTCVELDNRAIEFASNLCSPYSTQIQFVNKNILRFSTLQKYDVIWSAGLFDYFEDKIFVLALKKFLSWLKPGGEIIVGNFSLDNPFRGYMEIFGEWNLIHRSKEHLVSLAIIAGANPKNIYVDSEPFGINLFLRIKN